MFSNIIQKAIDFNVTPPSQQAEREAFLSLFATVVLIVLNTCHIPNSKLTKPISRKLCTNCPLVKVKTVIPLVGRRRIK